MLPVSATDPHRLQAIGTTRATASAASRTIPRGAGPPRTAPVASYRRCPRPSLTSESADVGSLGRFLGHAACVSTGCDHEAIFAGLRKRSWASREQAIEDAQRDEHADSLLAQMLDECADGTEGKVLIAAALGEVSGKDGDAALRRALNATGPGTSDLRCSALYGLARRCGEAAHEDFVRGLHSKDAGTRDFALGALAACGRDGVWDEVAARLASTMKRPDRRGSVPSDTLVMLAYLLRHAGSDPVRIPSLVRLLRRSWNGLDPRRDSDRDARQWVAEHWPDAAPGGPEPDEVEAPDAEIIDVWLRSQPFFAPLMRERREGTRISDDRQD